jgi:2-succinyl-5-enolpyruvyl-6-hydroxy-3-cyclohexene-1-carboxylate synthase
MTVLAEDVRAGGDTASLNFRWARALLGGLLAGGVGHAVVSPGSRSTPLVLACEALRGMQVHVMVDERSAAFFALGIARASGRPAAVIATSGSAPANWYPAVIEASQDLQPMVLLSADRPAELRGWGANQTIDQTRLFGVHVREFVGLAEPVAGARMLRYARAAGKRAVALALGPRPGPVHINVPFREPLVCHGDARVVSADRVGEPVSPRRPSPQASEICLVARSLSDCNGVIVCGRGPHGPEFPPAIAALAAQLRWPVLADPLSGLRFGAHDRSQVMSCYEAFLRRRSFADAHPPEAVLHFGAVPVSRALQNYIDTAADVHVLVAAHGVWPDPAHRATHVVAADSLSFCRRLMEAAPQPAEHGWVGAFRREELRARDLQQVTRHITLEAAVLASVMELCPEDALVFAGNSTVVRDIDAFVGGGDRPRFLAGNRGASGIDGNVSTALGMAAASLRPVVALLGDLALYHDMNGLIASRDLKATLIVFNNGGGAIFEYLPQARLERFERYWLTSTTLDLAMVAKLYGLGHATVKRSESFPEAFRDALHSTTSTLIEVKIDRAQSVAAHRAYWNAVAAD